MLKFLTCVTLLSLACAAPQAPAPAGGAPAPSSDATAEVKNYTEEINPDGSFSYQFDTSNGINIQQSGSVNGSIQGSVQYQSPEGEQIQLNYIADENGFQPSGAHLPTAPPVPAEIVKALEYIQAHPPAAQPDEPASS